jgi:S-(hydroxymethyl)glutathione dehydrogenase/alcohol dehydrogenase
MASNTSVSRRNVLKKAAAAVGGTAAAGLLGGGAAAQAPAQAPAIRTGTQAGRRYRAFVTFDNAPNTSIRAAKASVETVTMKALHEDRVVVRTEAAQVCYSIVGQVVGTFKPPAILGHSAVGIVDAIGTRVKRVQVGDRVLLANTPQCGVCYNCLRGRADRCINTSIDPTVIGTLSDGTEIVQQHDRGGFAELVITPESYCIPIFHNVPPVELSMLGCTGACGLGTTIGVAPVEVGSDVVVLGCGPLGLAAVQGAKIKGASQIIAVDPIAARRAVARQLGATTVIDPNVDTANVVARIRDLCKGPSARTFAGGRSDAQKGPDFVIEAVGGDVFPPKAEVGPDPTGVLSLQWAWTLCSSAGHVSTVAVGQKGNFTLPAAQWSNGAKNHHPGNFNGVSTLRDMQLFARLIETGQFNAKALGPDAFTLDRAKDALQAVSDRTTVGAAIVFS